MIIVREAHKVHITVRHRTGVASEGLEEGLRPAVGPAIYGRPIV